MKTMYNAKPHVSLIKEVRTLLNCTTKPYVIENVPGAPLNGALMLCGTMFGLGVDDADLRRHRIFEYEFDGLEIRQPKCRHSKRTIGIYGEGCRDSRRKFNKSIKEFTVQHGRDAMKIDWMTIAELCEAIPPAYSHYIAEQWKKEQS